MTEDNYIDNNILSQKANCVLSHPKGAKSYKLETYAKTMETIEIHGVEWGVA